MPGYSANLGFLWSHLPLAGAVHRAAQAGFAAVECHWPYEAPASELKAALREAGIPLLCINTPPGDLATGEFGLCALPDRVPEARRSISQALDYAMVSGAKAVHVMAGKEQGDDARQTLVANLRHAADLAAPHGITCLIEPINQGDVPDYFLSSFDLALSILDEVNAPNAALMFDCYHAAAMGEDVEALFHRCLPRIGHVQMAGFPGRNEPGTGSLNLASIAAAIRKAGWQEPIGAEYRPSSPEYPESGLGWMAVFPP